MSPATTLQARKRLVRAEPDRQRRSGGQDREMRMYEKALEERITEQLDAVRPSTDAIDVYCWRVEQLEQAGYSPATAHLLGEETTIDLHLACDLLLQGCPERTAYAILS
jgi:hypothetical protein